MHNNCKYKNATSNNECSEHSALHKPMNINEGCQSHMTWTLQDQVLRSVY